MPKLENWYIFTVGDKHQLIGEIYNDTRFPDGASVRTSTIQSFYRETMTVRTRNTLYQLGKPLPQADPVALNDILESIGEYAEVEERLKVGL